ncbi:hypothetical protein JOB18_034347, partial [Solea senegalensis]
ALRLSLLKDMENTTATHKPHHSKTPWRGSLLFNQLGRKAGIQPQTDSSG